MSDPHDTSPLYKGPVDDQLCGICGVRHMQPFAPVETLEGYGQTVSVSKEAVQAVQDRLAAEWPKPKHWIRVEGSHYKDPDIMKEILESTQAAKCGRGEHEGDGEFLSNDANNERIFRIECCFHCRVLYVPRSA